MTAPGPLHRGPLTVIRDPLQGTNFTAHAGRRFYLYTETGSHSFTGEFAPTEGEFGDVAAEWVQAERTGRQPLLMFKAYKLETFKATLLLRDKRDPYAGQGGAITALSLLSRSGERIMCRYSVAEMGLWRFTDLSFNIIRRHPVTDEPTHVTAAITLTRAADPDGTAGAGPLAGSPAPPPPPPVAPAPRVHVVRQGDTLWGIAQHYYGAGALWVRIWDVNRAVVRLPWKIHPGQRLVIP